MAALGIHAAITWRDRHNPLRGLTIAKAVQYLEEEYLHEDGSVREQLPL